MKLCECGCGLPAQYMEGVMERPSVCTDEMLDYLDELRESGEINMFGASITLGEQFGLSRIDARNVLSYWMQTFPREIRKL